MESDDDDMGDMWRLVKKQRADKRALNRQRSAALLTEASIEFISHNDGAHLLVAGKAWDFWPGTGLWSQRGKLAPGQRRLEGRGVHNLIQRIKHG